MGTPIEERLPPLTAAIILEMTGLEVFRDQFGMRQCLERGIGPRRRKLGPLPPTRIQFALPLAVEMRDMTAAEAMELARDDARALLTGLCVKCPFDACKMKAWGRITG